MEDYRDALDLVPEEPLQAFRACKAILAEMNALAKPQRQQEESILTRSLLELRFSVLRLSLSLALGLGEHQFVIDTCLKVARVLYILYSYINRRLMEMVMT